MRACAARVRNDSNGQTFKIDYARPHGLGTMEIEFRYAVQQIRYE